jgi:signal peptidase II
MNKNKSLLGYLFFISIIITLDQALKRWAINALQNGNDISVTSWFKFSLASNRGVSWGFLNFQSSQGFYLLTILIIFTIAGFATYAIIQHLNRTKVYFESMVIGGAISNVIDRINYGYVIDFVDIHIHAWHWPTFNVADAFIVAGVCGILLSTVYKK